MRNGKACGAVGLRSSSVLRNAVPQKSSFPRQPGSQTAQTAQTARKAAIQARNPARCRRSRAPELQNLCKIIADLIIFSYFYGDFLIVAVFR